MSNGTSSWREIPFFILNGEGNRFLSDDGTYKNVEASTISISKSFTGSINIPIEDIVEGRSRVDIKYTAVNEDNASLDTDAVNLRQLRQEIASSQDITGIVRVVHMRNTYRLPM